MINEQFDEVYTIMQASFPDIELRTYNGQKKLLSHPNYRLVTETDGGSQTVAFMAVWEFPEFRFVEHFAVAQAARGGGMGGKLMTRYIGEGAGPVLLEVEPPDTALAQRRIHFYERLGFHLNPYEYMQPPLKEGMPDLPLKIMSYPGPLTKDEFGQYQKVLYREVYSLHRNELV